MGTAVLIIIGIIVGFAIIGFLFSKDGEREDAAKTGAILGGAFVVNLLPVVIVIVLAVLIVKSCS
ncbi:hypothetical protein JM83_1789 [Gillisia sp. Hel_I_86]|uniref:hypothetical protein n=1 Tax=Gillisia sp. Hel_I_86 TaxID=1249981 RepID=UPI00119AB196|nr:hypothetical protein [Gillisia sp. Hel_I_86]TVZ26799.1 hypothetical protein JM83_1789 [Gillisia sp. Hel_I_86]